MTDRLVSVAVPVPALGLLTYRVPPDQAMPVPGARVVVPLGPRKLTGVAVGQVSAADVTFKLKDIIQVLDAGAFVPSDVVKLTQWVSDYYLAGPGATLAAALPPQGLTNKVDRFKTVRVVTLTAAGLVRLTTSLAEVVSRTTFVKRVWRQPHSFLSCKDDENRWHSPCFGQGACLAENRLVLD